MRLAWLLATLLLVVPAGAQTLRLPSYANASGEAFAVSVSPESGTLVGPGGQPLFLRGFWRGDRIPGSTASLWEASPEIRHSWLTQLRTNGFNCLALTAWPGDDDLEAVLPTLKDLQIWLLFDAPAPRPSFEMFGPEAMLPIDWARFRDHVPPLVTLEAVTPEAVARAAIQPMSGLMLASPEIAEGEERTLLLAVALWTSMVPWHDLPGPIESAGPLGVRGRMRTDADRRNALLLLPPEEGAASLTLRGLAEEPLLIDLFSLETMHRRRQAIQGPEATIPLGPRDRLDHALVLITPLPDDWALPESDLAEP